MELLTSNQTYVAIIIALTIGYIIGKTRGKLEALSSINAQQAKKEAEMMMQKTMSEMMRGFSNEK